MSEHYFTAAPSAADVTHTFDVSIRGRKYQVTTSSGVFSPHDIDKGTAVLLDKVPLASDSLPEVSDDAAAPSDPSAGASGETASGETASGDGPSGRPIAVDVGCGWGPITLALAAEAPGARVVGVDVNERARALAAANAEANGLTNAEILAPEDAAGLTDVDLIWSNPPIRIGKDALHALLLEWLPRLAPTGVAYLVVQKNLGADSLAGWMRGEGFAVEKIGSSKGFRVLEVRR